MENALVVKQDADLIPASLTPQEQVEKASEMAKVLQDVVKQANLSRKFGGKKEHLEYEAWQTIGQFFNCTPVTEWTRPFMEGEKIVGWECRVEIHNEHGRVIAAAENMCMRDEPNWKSKPNYALRSMAQTRAAGKALRSVFAFVAVLAGYSATPSEEMGFNNEPKKQPPPEFCTADQLNTLNKLGEENSLSNAEVAQLATWYRKGKRLTNKEAETLIRDFNKILDEYIDEKQGSG